AQRSSGRMKTLWLQRPVKITSYCMNGTIGGYAGKAGDLAGKTFKTSDFLPTDWAYWEQNESDPFFFNDAGNNPESAGETISLRHSGLPNHLSRPPSAAQRNLPGGSIVGGVGGTAQFVKWSKTYDLINRRVPAPNELLAGPDFR
ncbi:MAG: hypothetical protein ACO1QB_06975, partial [Verrucomicrobiales bacterium]